MAAGPPVWEVDGGEGQGQGYAQEGILTDGMGMKEEVF